MSSDAEYNLRGELTDKIIIMNPIPCVATSKQKSCWKVMLERDCYESLENLCLLNITWHQV